MWFKCIIISKGVKKNMEKRNFGIDILRLTAAFMIVVLHCLTQGGLKDNVEDGTSTSYVVIAMLVLTYGAVDIFALISGYVSYSEKEKKYSFSNVIYLWFITIFYGVFITIMYHISKPDVITWKDYVKGLMPITNNTYWYLNAYIGLVIFKPFIDKMLRSITNGFAFSIAVVFLAAFSFYETMTHSFSLNNGYSVLWLIVLYYIGAVIKKCEIDKKSKTSICVILLLLSYIITVLSLIFMRDVGIINISINKTVLLSYTSPTIVLFCSMLLILFSKIRIKGVMKSIVELLSPLAFTVYIINCHDCIWEYVMKDLFLKSVVKDGLKVFGEIMIFSFCFFAICIMLDMMRNYLFKSINVKSLSVKLEGLIVRIVKKIGPKVTETRIID